MENNAHYILLYPNIVPVRGYNRSILMDLYMGDFLFIPNYFCDFLTEHQAQKLRYADFMKLGASESDFKEIESLLHYLIGKDYLTVADDDLFEGLSTPIPAMTQDALIDDCIIELSDKSDWDLVHFLSEINRIGVKFLEIRFLDFEALKRFQRPVQSGLQDHSVEFLHWIVPFNPELEQLIWDELKDFHRLDQLTVYNTSTEFELNGSSFQINFSTQPSIHHSHCGCIDRSYFSSNVITYYGNRTYNNCLSHKLSIDQFGDIRNCPSKKESYGKLSGVDLRRTVNLEEFQKEWRITKESILICSDCEFRWMCSDCRVFIQDQTNPFSKPSKCGYNPFISLWKDEENYLSEEACGIRFENGKLHIPAERINQINARIWG